MAYKITDACVACGTCIGECPVEAISAGDIYVIDPDKCISCGRCEERCRAQCVKVVSRYVDASRCVMCFDCVADCPTGAIRYQRNRNRPATPLVRRVKNSSKT